MAGYKKPPEATRFQKGQSGNPKGRPKKHNISSNPLSANALALEEARRLLDVRQGEKVSKMSAIRAVVRAQYNAALKGNPIAQKDVVSQFKLAEQEEVRVFEKAREIYSEYVRVMGRKFAIAKANGEPEPLQYPNPDDIVIDDVKRVIRCVGPWDQKEALQLENLLKERELLFLQYELDWRHYGWKHEDETAMQPGALFLMIYREQFVPRRFQLTDGAIGNRMMTCKAMTKRDLLRDLYRGWQSLGYRFPRGKRFPTQGWMNDFFEFGLKHLNKIAAAN